MQAVMFLSEMKLQGIGVTGVLLGLLLGIWLTLKVVRWALRNYDPGF